MPIVIAERPVEIMIKTSHDMLTHKTIADVVGLTKFRNTRQEKANVAIALASYRGVDTIDEEHIDMKPRVSAFESVLQSVDKRLGEKTHNTRHRTANRFHKRVTVIKLLVDLVKFKAPAKFTSSAADLRCLNLVVRQVIDDAVKDGVEYSDRVLTVRKQERAYYLKAVGAAYFIKDEDDEFWSSLVKASGSPGD
jgi:hypothetical protein